MSRKPKNTGLEWLCLSMASFNGSGYADKATPDSYMESYRAYKQWKRDGKAVALVDEYYEQVYDYAVTLCQARDAGHFPSEQNLQRFRRFYNPEEVRIT